MIEVSDLFKLNRFHTPPRYRLFSMGMCTVSGGWTYYDEDLGSRYANRAEVVPDGDLLPRMSRAQVC